MRILFVVVLIAISGYSFSNPPDFTFVENISQWDCSIQYAANLPVGNMTLKSGSFGYYFLDYERLEVLHHNTHDAFGAHNEASSEESISAAFVSVIFRGADRGVVPVPLAKRDEYYNFFLGSDSSRWASGANAYDGVLYPSLYNGIDLKVYNSQDNLKYDFILAPGANPSLISMEYEGAERVYLQNGDLHVSVGFSGFSEKNPIAYQVVNGKKVYVSCSFVVSGNIVSFDFPDGYDPCYELVIDPLLIFSTFSGSRADNWGSTATPGEKGTLYSSGVTNHMVGTSFSGTFPASPGAFQASYGGVYDIAILKYDSAGQRLLYATYLGGSRSESPHSLVVNEQNELILLGTTSSANFPVTANAYDRIFSGGTGVNHVVQYAEGSDIVLSRISSDGRQLIASTYFGGQENDGLNQLSLNGNYGDECRGDVIADKAGNIYVATVTQSPDLRLNNAYRGGFSDAIILKFPPSLNSLITGYYLGGSGEDGAHSIKLGIDGSIYTAGGTTSADFPVSTTALQTAYGGGTDGWVAKLDADASILNATYSGTMGYEQVYFIDTNSAGDIYVYGQNTGHRPLTPGVYSDPNSGQFIQKLSNDLATQFFYTEFGTGKGTPDISPTAFLVTDCNYIYLAGWGGDLNLAGGRFNTSTRGLKTSGDAYQRTTAGHDFYFLVLGDDARTFLYASFLGGGLSKTHVDGGTSRFDKRGIVYHAVCAGCRGGTPNGLPASDFPTTTGAFSRTNNSLNCTNAAFKFDLSLLRSALKIRGAASVCLPDKITIDNLSVGADFYIWDFGDNTAPVVTTKPSPMAHEYKVPGRYIVWLKAINNKACITRDSTSVVIDVVASKSEFPSDVAICRGTSATLIAKGGTLYEWRSEDNKFKVSGAFPQVTVAPRDTTRYNVSILEANGCRREDSLYVNVIPLINPDFELERGDNCEQNNLQQALSIKVRNLTDSTWAGDSFQFHFGDGTVSDQEETEYQYKAGGTYQLKLIAVREFCVAEKLFPLSIGPLKYPNVITPGGSLSLNDNFTIQFGDSPGGAPFDFGFRVGVEIYDRWGKLVYQDSDYRNDWSGADVSGGVYYYQVSVDQHKTCKGWLHVVK